MLALQLIGWAFIAGVALAAFLAPVWLAYRLCWPPAPPAEDEAP